MKKLQDPYIWEVNVEGKTYKVFPYWNRILQICDLQEAKDMTEPDIILAQADILTKGKYRLSVHTAAKILENTFSALNEGTRAEKRGKKYFDYDQDSGLILAAFMQSYRIDLKQEIDKMHYQKFLALFSAMPDDTRLAEVMKIRAKPIPAPTKHNAEEIKALIRLKEYWKLKISQEEREENFKKGLMSMYFALEKLAKGG